MTYFTVKTFYFSLCFKVYLGKIISPLCLFCCCLVFKMYATVGITLWTVAHLTPLSMGFPRQEYWIGLPFPSPGDLSDPGIKPSSLALIGGFFTTEPPGKPPKLHSPTIGELGKGTIWTHTWRAQWISSPLPYLLGHIIPLCLLENVFFYTHTHTHTHICTHTHTKINHPYAKCIYTYFVCFFYFHYPTFIFNSRFSCTIPQILWGHVFNGLEILTIFFLKKKNSPCVVV